MGPTLSLEKKLVRALWAIPSFSLGEAIWYGSLAALVWLAFYVVLRKVLARRKIVATRPSAKQIGEEIAYSLRSICLFGLVGGGVVFSKLSGFSHVYLKIADYGWAWFAVSILLMIAMHDTYFYWTHRLMHDPRLFRVFHRTHHLSMSPTPWAAYSFSPWEALVQAGIAPLVLFTIPVHPLAFTVFMGWQITFNVMGHCGYEIFPRWFLETRVGQFLNTPTHHAMHHEKFRSNFGLYFNVWDRLMGTNNPDYEDRFVEVTGGAARS